MNLIKSNLSWMTFPAIPDKQASLELGIQFQLQNSQWLNPDEIKKHQLQQLLPLLQHAKQTTSHYSQALPSIHAVFSWEDFHQLPLLDRETARNQAGTIISHSPPSAHSNIRTIQTSGSTGTPVTVYLSDINNLLWRSFALREHIWHQRDVSKMLCSIRWLDRQNGMYPNSITTPSWGAATEAIYKTGNAHILNVSSTVDNQLQWIIEKQPAYLLTFPSNLVAITERAAERAMVLPPLLGLRTIGETLKLTDRQFIEQHWNCKIQDIYSCEEAGYLALQCPEHDHYHIQSENVILEILDDNNQPCKHGEEGKVVITALHNYCSPLIRYELGDRAVLGDICDCGRGLPVLKKIYGRQRNRLLMPDGRREFPYLGEHGQIKSITGIQPRQIQLRQKSAYLIQLYFAVDMPFTPDQEQKIIRLYQGHLGNHFQFEFHYVEHIPKGARGKFDDFACDC